MNLVTSKVLLATVFGLDDDTFMLTVGVIILLVLSTCLVLAMVFRGSHVTPAAPPAAELSKAPDEESVAGSSTVEASTKSQLPFERM